MLSAPRRTLRGAGRPAHDYARIYRAVAEVTGARVVVDASKGPALGQALAGAPGIDLRMLNVVRDPRAVAWSWQREVDRPHDAAGHDQMWRIPAHRAAAQWSGLQLEMAAIAGVGRRPRPHGCATRTSWPTRSAPLVAATAALGLPLAATDLPAVDERRVVLGAQPRAVGQPGALPLRRRASCVGTTVDHRDAGEPTARS